MNKAVLFLIFNRPEITKKVFNTIRQAKPPRLYLASDGARKNKVNENFIVQEVRKFVLENIDWKCKVKTNFNKKNLGCRKSVSSSISWFFKFEKDGIILEDDCLPSQSFFTFCEELLNYYKDNKKIMHISGDNFSPNFLDKSSYFFTKIQHCWGWATWSDRWKYYGKNLKNFYSRDLVKFSDEIKIQKYWGNILQKMNNDEIDSWAYQWAFKIVKRNGLCINPTVNLISNIGFSRDGLHTVDSNNPYANLPTFNIKKIVHPNKVVLDKKAVKYIYKNHYGIKNI